MNKLKKWMSIILTITLLCTTLLPANMIVKASLLPLTEVKAYLALNGYTNEELERMSIDSMLSMLKDSDGNSIEIADDATTVWQYVKDDIDDIETYYEYTIGNDEKINLSYHDGVTSYEMELIVGKDGQLNKKNIRYIIKVYVSDSYSENLNFELYNNESGYKTIVNPVRTDFSTGEYKLLTIDGSYINAEKIIYGQILKEPINVNNAYLNITSERVNHPNITAKVWEWNDYNVNLMLGYEVFPPITDKVLNQDMSSQNAGMPCSDLRAKNLDSLIFVVLYYLDDTLFDAKVLGLQLAAGYIAYDGGMYLEKNDSFVNVTNNVFHSSDSRVWKMTYELKDGYSVSEQYNFKLEIHGAGKNNKNYNSIAEKAVVGHYDSLEGASNKEDIKDRLLTDIGYKSDYSGDGVDFTVFFPEGTFSDGDVKKFTISTVEFQDDMREFTEKPIIGEADPWLRVTGATDCNGRKYDTYAIENGKNCNMDTYYGYGYQTIFIKDKNEDEDVDLSSIKPEFWYANTDRVYAISKDSGNRVDENHTRDFKNENQQYTGVIIDNNKENERNYWITFKKLNKSGPELYVYGPSEREVILDEYFEFKHDILIANIGNAPLEDISVELLDAENVKLDPYWNVGGNGNNTLAPFTTTSSDAKYGELPNIAKIRLLPDGDGEVKGTLKISAQGQKPVLIRLNGTAQKPDIINEKLSDAVKYVPYQQIIATNNIHDWIKTQFSIVDGTLPAGITLNSETGEIYGVPRVPDGDTETTYTFTVEANYFVDGRDGYFEPSRKEFTLTVKPNTNENVYLASDEGYGIKQSIGTETTNQYEFVLENIEDTIFTSHGEYNQFVDLWLNGVRLVEGVDYTKKPGSTKITIKSQTFENKTNNGESNTIAMEFRNEDNKLNRTSQNFITKMETNVDIVIEKIKALPAVSDVTVSNKSAVQAARNAYDALSSNDKDKVTNRQKLFDLETKITALEEVNKVIEKINSIPANITSDAKDEIQAARTAYDVLTDEQKKLVTNFDRLVKAEQILSKYEADIAAAQKVDNLIKNLPSPLKLADEDKVNNARTAYSNLTADQKRYVTKEEALRAAENEIVRLKAEAQKQAKINAVISAIDAIPENLTLSDKSIVEAARTAYNTLADSQKKKVVNINKLTKAENTIDALEAQKNASKADRAAAQKVIDLIDDLPKETNLGDKSTIEAARAAYEKLTNKQKKLVTNYGDLTEAEEAIKALENYEAASKKDQVAADEVINLINAIPSDISLDDKATVETARNAYNALTDNQKKIVINYKTLIDAEVVIAKIENDNYKETKSITFVGILVDKEGKALADRIVEIHSVVQTGRTDENGSFQFNSVEFGEHTIFIKDDNGNIIAQREFNIIQGSPISLKGNDVIAENGSIFTIKMQLDNGELIFLNIEEGNKAPVINTDKNNESIYDEEDKNNNQDNVIIPNTGDDSNVALWIILLLVSIVGLVITRHSGYKQRMYSNGHGRV